MIGVVSLHGQRQCCKHLLPFSLIRNSLFFSYPHLIEKLIVLNAPHPIAFQQELSLAQLFRSWYMFFYQSPILPEMILQADDFAVFHRVFQQKPAGLINKDLINNEDIEVYKYTFSQQGK